MSPQEDIPPPRQADSLVFYCDAMLGGLARWLRAAGYEAHFEYGIADRELVRRTEEGGGILLSSDGPMFERTVIRTGRVQALYIPQQMNNLQQLGFVMARLGLSLLAPRCMSCGGELLTLPKHEVMGEAPPLAYRHCSDFYRCRACGKLFWKGTHWQRIRQRLDQADRQARLDAQR